MFFKTRRSARHMALACERVVHATRHTLSTGEVERGWTIIHKGTGKAAAPRRT